MIATLKAFSILLCYPKADVRESAPGFADLVRAEGLIEEPHLGDFLDFLSDFSHQDLYDLQERYVFLFDRTRSLSLQLFEHVHGESRDRGQAMVNLLEIYEQHDLALNARELPDYLPLFLEFTSTLPLSEARAMIREIQHIISVLEERLRKRNSSYASVFGGINALAQGKEGEMHAGDILDLPDDDPEDLEELDHLWEEQPVTFAPTMPGGTSAGGCPVARRTLAQMDYRTSGEDGLKEERLLQSTRSTS